MPFYEFSCKKCQSDYDELCNYDPTDKYKGVKCPNCGSKNKTKRISKPNIAGTSARNNIFSNLAGKNLSRAKGERRAAEATSHVGPTPHVDINDLNTGNPFDSATW